MDEIKIPEEELPDEEVEDDELVLKVLRANESDEEDSDGEEVDDEEDHITSQVPPLTFSRTESITQKLGRKMNLWMKRCFSK